MDDEKEIEVFRDRLRQLERIILSRVRESTYCSGLTVNQGHILLCLSRSGGSNLTELNGELRLDKASLSRTVSLLVEKGYIRQRVDRKDRRVQLLELTEEGREFVGKLDRASIESFGSVYTGLDEKFREDMNGYLDALIESMVKTQFPRGNCGNNNGGGCQ